MTTIYLPVLIVVMHFFYILCFSSCPQLGLSTVSMHEGTHLLFDHLYVYAFVIPLFTASRFFMLVPVLVYSCTQKFINIILYKHCLSFVCQWQLASVPTYRKYCRKIKY